MPSALSAPHFHNEAAAYAHVEARIWPEGPICPHCGCMGRISAIKPNPEKRVRIGLKKCGDCKKQFTVKVGTVFEQSHVPLNIWLQALALLTASKKGISSNELARILGVGLKTAWFMAHRIREAMVGDALAPFGSGGSTVEADETFIGFDPNRAFKRKASGAHMNKVLRIVDRETGEARSFVVPRVTARDIAPILADHISPHAVLSTDKGRHYMTAGKGFADHLTVDHGAGEYVRGDAHTNTVEGSFSIFKRGMRGVYQHCSAKHLHRYLAEFDFRYSNRAKLGVDDARRAEIALEGISGKRLTYRTVSSRRPGAEARVVW
jgi:transposase-like protein